MGASREQSMLDLITTNHREANHPFRLFAMAPFLSISWDMDRGCDDSYMPRVCSTTLEQKEPLLSAPFNRT